MRIIGIIAGLVALLSLVGCYSAPSGGSVIPVPSQPTIMGNGQQLGPIDTSVGANSIPDNSSPAPVLGNPSPNQSSAWGLALPEGIVNASSVLPGYSGTYESPLLNVGDSDIYVSIYYRVPGNTRAGYISLGDSASDWLVIEPNVLSIPAKGKAYVKITLSVPDNAVLLGDKMEFWVAYAQVVGGVTQRLNQRWLLTTGK